MKKPILLIGPIASGKTTYAADMITDLPEHHFGHHELISTLATIKAFLKYHAANYSLIVFDDIQEPVRFLNLLDTTDCPKILFESEKQIVYCVQSQADLSQLILLNQRVKVIKFPDSFAIVKKASAI
jgi:predicted AAA+ superfamily ATPase